MTSTLTIDNRIAGALLALACGDALGAPAEFQSKSEVRSQWGRLTEMVGGGPWRPGEWTDDTAMSLGVAEGILSAPSDPVPAAGQCFLQWSKTAKDVGNIISAALSAFRGDWPTSARNTPQARSGKAAGNGSLMRTLPVALAYPDKKTMLRQSARLSAMTHWDAQAEVCCAVYCLWVQALLGGQERQAAWRTSLQKGRTIAVSGPLTTDSPGPTPLPDGFWERLEAIGSKSYSQLQPSGYAGYVVECLEAAVWCVLHADSLEEALIQAVNLAGEADTIAAVAGGAAGAFWGLEAIPQRWLEALYRRTDLEDIARRLIHLRRHEVIYSKQGLPSFNYEWVTGRILAGRNPLSAHDIHTLAALGITHILDLREPEEWTAPKLGAEAVEEVERCDLRRLNLVIKDLGAASSSDFGVACRFIDEALAEPDARVYVHCRAGMERTAAILVAWYARQHGVSYDHALAELKKGRPILQPLPNQASAVCEWLHQQPARNHIS